MLYPSADLTLSHLCSKHPHESSAPSVSPLSSRWCLQCFCFICDVSAASCTAWGDGECQLLKLTCRPACFVLQCSELPLPSQQFTNDVILIEFTPMVYL